MNVLHPFDSDCPGIPWHATLIMNIMIDLNPRPLTILYVLEHDNAVAACWKLREDGLNSSSIRTSFPHTAELGISMAE